jgi:hypothetical protein
MSTHEERARGTSWRIWASEYAPLFVINVGVCGRVHTHGWCKRLRRLVDSNHKRNLFKAREQGGNIQANQLGLMTESDQIMCLSWAHGRHVRVRYAP